MSTPDEREELLRRLITGDAGPEDVARSDADPELSAHVSELQGVLAQLDAAGAKRRESLTRAALDAGQVPGEEEMLRETLELARKRPSWLVLLSGLAVAAALVLAFVLTRPPGGASEDPFESIEHLRVMLSSGGIDLDPIERRTDGVRVFSWDYGLLAGGSFQLTIWDGDAGPDAEPLFKSAKYFENTWTSEGQPEVSAARSVRLLLIAYDDQGFEEARVSAQP